MPHEMSRETQLGLGEEILVDNIEQLESSASNDLRRLCSKAYRLLGNAHDAEDAVQDAFLSAYQHLTQFQGRARLSTWFTTIVINSARMQLRRRIRRTVAFDPQFQSNDEQLSFMETVPDNRLGPEEICKNGEIDNLLSSSIDQLSPTLRKAAQIYFVEGLNLADAAQVLGVPLGTFKAQVARARAKLIRSVRKTLGLSISTHTLSRDGDTSRSENRASTAGQAATLGSR